MKHLDDSGNISKTIAVPIRFGPQDKFRMLRKEEESGVKYYLPLPNMALTLDGFRYASNRVAGSKETRYMTDPDLSIDDLYHYITDMNPVPYDLTYNLRIQTESMDEYCQILENILPYFNPSITLQIKEFPDINIERDLNVKLEDNPTIEYLDPQGENERRYVNGILTFTVEAYMYQPMSTEKIIKNIKSSYFINSFINVSGIGTSDNFNEHTNILTERYITSGFNSTSAFEVIHTSAFSYSGSFEGFNQNTSGTIYYTTSASNYT